jgi:hypothetical protein
VYSPGANRRGGIWYRGRESIDLAVDDAARSETETSKRLTIGTRWRCFEKRKKTIEVELQHGMPRPGTGKQTTQMQSTAMST